MRVLFSLQCPEIRFGCVVFHARFVEIAMVITNRSVEERRMPAGIDPPLNLKEDNPLLTARFRTQSVVIKPTSLFLKESQIYATHIYFIDFKQV
jgi:hypothetical protein